MSLGTGDFFIKLGYVIDPNTTRMYNETFNYYEMDNNTFFRGHYANIIGLRVGVDNGEIIDMGPGGGMEKDFEISGYNDFVNSTYGTLGYLYDVGDIVWLNIKLKPIVDMPLTTCWIRTGDWGEEYDPYFDPVNGSYLKQTVDLFAGIETVLNFSFKILRELPHPGGINSVIFSFQSDHSLVMITENQGRDYGTGNIGLPIWTSLPDPGTRSCPYYHIMPEEFPIVDDGIAMNIKEIKERGE
jgi:hypothetical protein